MAERRIGGRTYRYDKANGADGLRILLRALKLLAPAGPLLEAVASGDEAKEPAALLAAIDGLDGDAIATLITDLVSQTRENGRLIGDTFGVMPREELLQVGLFALQVEFGAFWTEGAGAVIRRAGLMVGPQVNIASSFGTAA